CFGETSDDRICAHAGCRAVRTAHSWRGILPFTHLAREGRMTVTIGRRELLAALGGTAAAWPLAARAQQPERMRRCGVLSPLREEDPEWVARRAVFEQALQALGWSIGRDLRIDYRWTGIDPATIEKFAAELAALAPDVILPTSNIVIPPMLRAAR